MADLVAGKLHIYPTELFLYTFIKSLDETRLHVSENGKQQELVVQKSINNLALPVATSIKKLPTSSDITTAGMVVLPLNGGGRGPIINYGEVISVGLLKSILANVLDEDEMTVAFKARLDALPYMYTNPVEESGIGTNNTVIALGYLAPGYPPKITITPSHGEMIHVIETHVGVDPDCITYREIPPQEIICGYGGLSLARTFTIKAAILEKAVPIVVTPNWAPVAVAGPPSLFITTALSPTYTSAVAHMAFRIQGTLTLASTTAFDVSGYVALKASFNMDDLKTVVHLRHNFNSGPATITIPFDEVIVLNQAIHNYVFQGSLSVDSDDEVNRELTGTVTVDTVTEFGSGAVLSNDLYVKWASKE